MEEKKDILEQFRGSGCDGILLYIPEIEAFVSLSIGSGNNLLPEERKEGYDACIDIYTYEYDNSSLTFTEADGGEMAYKTSEKNYDEDICNAVEDVLSFFYSDVSVYIPIKTFDR